MKRVNFDNDFDANGILKDGHRMRVPLRMMDHAQRDTTSMGYTDD